MIWTLIALLLIAAFREVTHRKTAYYQVTRIPYYQMRFDLGRFGEYLTYKYLRRHEKEGAKFLFNLYIPKGDDGTTEIDVLMIAPQGLFVFESKNYSGWIFGSEHQLKWYQTLPQGRGQSRKEAFYNPVMQNRTHIKHLKALLGDALPMHSIVTFSDRCTLKKVQITSPDVHVINRSQVVALAASICSSSAALLSEAQVQELYDKLYPFTQVDASVRAKHIEDIEQSVNPEPAPFVPPAAEPAPAEAAAPVPPRSEVQPMRCPRCGGELILRTARKGTNTGNRFYGCGNFPKCRYTQDL